MGKEKQSQALVESRPVYLGKDEDSLAEIRDTRKLRVRYFVFLRFASLCVSTMTNIKFILQNPFYSVVRQILYITYILILKMVMESHKPVLFKRFLRFFF